MKRLSCGTLRSVIAAIATALFSTGKRIVIIYVALLFAVAVIIMFSRPPRVGNSIFAIFRCVKWSIRKLKWYWITGCISKHAPHELPVFTTGTRTIFTSTIKIRIHFKVLSLYTWHNIRWGLQAWRTKTALVAIKDVFEEAAYAF